MKEDGIVFVNQLLIKLEESIQKLEKAKEDNEPREFNDLKKKAFDIHTEIERLIE